MKFRHNQMVYSVWKIVHFSIVNITKRPDQKWFPSAMSLIWEVTWISIMSRKCFPNYITFLYQTNETSYLSCKYSPISFHGSCFLRRNLGSVHEALPFSNPDLPLVCPNTTPFTSWHSNLTQESMAQRGKEIYSMDLRHTKCSVAMCKCMWAFC